MSEKGHQSPPGLQQLRMTPPLVPQVLRRLWGPWTLLAALWPHVFFPTSLCGVLIFGCALPSASAPPPPASSVTLSTQLSHTQRLIHTQLTNTQLSHTLLTHRQLAHTQLFHTQLTHTQLTHRQLAHTQLSHTQLTHTQLSHTHKLPTHNSLTHTTYSHTAYTHTTLTHKVTHTHNFLTHWIKPQGHTEDVFTVPAGPQSESQDLQGADAALLSHLRFWSIGCSDSEALWENALFCKNVLFERPSAMHSGIQMHRSRYKRLAAFLLCWSWAMVRLASSNWRCKLLISFSTSLLCCNGEMMNWAISSIRWALSAFVKLSPPLAPLWTACALVALSRSMPLARTCFNIVSTKTDSRMLRVRTPVNHPWPRYLNPWFCQPM